jgi:hypothetical protein
MHQLVIVLLLSSTLAIPATDADACVRPVASSSPRPSSSVAEIDRATDDLNAGRNVAAIARLYDEFGAKLNGWAFNPVVATSLQREAVLIVALSTLRTAGRFRRDSQADAVHDPELVRANLDWAIRAMEGLAYVGQVSQRHLAEAWARDPGLEDAARARLQTLADEGKLLSPFQFEALARLYDRQGKTRRAMWARQKAAEKRLD